MISFKVIFFNYISENIFIEFNFYSNFIYTNLLNHLSDKGLFFKFLKD